MLGPFKNVLESFCAGLVVTTVEYSPYVPSESVTRTTHARLMVMPVVLTDVPMLVPVADPTVAVGADAAAVQTPPVQLTQEKVTVGQVSPAAVQAVRKFAPTTVKDCALVLLVNVDGLT